MWEVIILWLALMALIFYVKKKPQKRKIIIDGQNVAYHHSNFDKKKFSVKGLLICIKYFQDKGFDVIAFIPEFRIRNDRTNKLKKLSGIVCGTVSCSNEDRTILEAAARDDGVVISNDKYREFIDENSEFCNIIKNRLVGFTWARDDFYLPYDPYGKDGPKLNDILYKTNQ